MARNDIVLLDSLIEEARPAFGDREDSEYFELFCFDQILKDLEPSYEELEFGWVDGGDDGGIDGLYVALDDLLLTETPTQSTRRNPNLDLFIVTAKSRPSFTQAPLNSLLSSLPELLDLTKEESELKYPFSGQVLEQRALFRETYVSLAERHPSLRLHVVYANRGDVDKISPNISSRAELIQNELLQLFSDAEARVEFLGARELLLLARKQRLYSLRLRFIEGTISRERTNYVLLCLLRDYNDFVTDDELKLRRYLFESNVRDYLGQVAINRDIASTLESGESRKDVDFWWLNNGITLLASAATVAGKDLNLENVQIVNGLQTTETIYRYFAEHPGQEDDRAVLLKVIVAADETVRDRIIKATNYQNMVDLASLRGTEKIQKDIEDLLGDHGWFYDRRKGYHKNQGRPAERILSVAYVGSAVQAIALRNFSIGFGSRTRWLRKDATYSTVFSEKLDIRIYLICAELAKKAEAFLQGRVRARGRYGRRAAALAIASVWVSTRLGRNNYKPDQVADLATQQPTKQEMKSIWQRLGRPHVATRRSVNSLARKVRSLDPRPE